MGDKNENIVAKSNFFRDFLEQQNQSWELSATNYRGLERVEEKEFHFKGFRIKVQFNPERIRSSSAKVDRESIAARKCFLCTENRPTEQKSLAIGNDFILLVNPFPIFRTHYTITSVSHTDQRILPSLGSMFEISQKMEGYTLFYNGPECGASAPDHLHFQAGENGFMPVEEEFETMKTDERALLFNSEHLRVWAFDKYLRKMISFVSESREEGILAIEKVYSKFRDIQPEKPEPMINLLCYFMNKKWHIHLFPRRLHRPPQFSKQGPEQLLISPASVDFGGVFITPRREDFEKITSGDITDIFAQVCLDDANFVLLKNAITNIDL
jgi:ATP adenylyltransferase/5',5'''-P-1,P-4-tetraphosphate phosphorylase II